jgi:hypothetical protein
MRHFRATHREELNAYSRAFYAAGNTYYKYDAAKSKARYDPEASKRGYENRRKARPWNQMLIGVKWRARKRGLAFDLDEAWCSERWAAGCALTGTPFEVVMGGRPGPRSFSPSIDRIDNTKGYTKDNCRILLFCVNAFKGELSDSKLLELAKAIVERNVL